MVAQFCENTRTYLMVYFIGSPSELLQFTKVQMKQNGHGKEPISIR